MGQSTDGILFYGYVWSDEKQLILPDGFDPEVEELVGEMEPWKKVALRRGLVDPWATYPSEGALLEVGKRLAPADLPRDPWEGPDRVYTRWAGQLHQYVHADLFAAWKRAEKDFEGEYGVDIAEHCSCEAAMPYLYVKTTRVRASRGYPEAIDPAIFATHLEGEWNAELQRFIDDLGIDMTGGEYGDPPQGPGWFLVSMWC